MDENADDGNYGGSPGECHGHVVVVVTVAQATLDAPSPLSRIAILASCRNWDNGSVIGAGKNWSLLMSECR